MSRTLHYITCTYEWMVSISNHTLATVRYCKKTLNTSEDMVASEQQTLLELNHPENVCQKGFAYFTYMWD